MNRLARPAIALFLFAVLAHAIDITKLSPQGYVSDFAGVVDGASKAALEKYCKEVEASTGAQIALVTLPSLEGEPIEDFTNSLYRRWGVGQKKTDEGAMLLLVVNDRKSRLEVGYGLEPYIPDGFAGSLLREMRPALRAGQYAGALSIAANTLGNRIASGKGTQIQPVPVTSRSPRSDGFPAWPFFLGFIVLMMFLQGLRRKGRYARPTSTGDILIAALLGQLLGGGSRGGYHGRSGGGFGGFDSSGGFGGFGGGSSGGGGASGDW